MTIASHKYQQKYHPVMTDRRVQVLYILGIVIICFIAHHRLPTHPWTYDDLDHIASAQHAHEQGFTTIFHHDVKEPTRWILNLYFYFIYPIFGENPAGYHAINVLLHILNACLCAYLILRLFHDPLMAGLSGLLFALHCAPYEAIYKISAAGVLFGTTAAMLSVLFTQCYLDTRRFVYATGAVIAYFVAIFSYESLLSVLIPVLYLCWIHKPKKIGLPIALFVPLAIFIVLDTTVYATADYKVSFNAMTLGWHIFFNFGFFVARLFVNAYLTPFGWDGPPPFDIGLPYFDHYAITGGVVAVLLCVLSLRNSTVRFAALWIFATISPYLFGAKQFYFSRYWYLSSIGGVLVISFFFNKLYRQLALSPRHKSVLLITVLLILAVFSFRKMYHYEGRFLTDAANFYLTHRKDAPTAIRLYERAEKYAIQHPILYHHQAIAYERVQDYEKAQNAILKAIQFGPVFTKSYLVLSEVAYKREEFETAINVALYATQLDKKLIRELHNLADRLQQDHHDDDALSAYGKIIAHYPDYAELRTCYLSISSILYRNNRYQEALSILHDLLQIYPDYVEAKEFLREIEAKEEP